MLCAPAEVKSIILLAFTLTGGVVDDEKVLGSKVPDIAMVPAGNVITDAPRLPLMLRLLYVPIVIVWAPVPLKFTVLPVTVNAPAPRVNVPQIPMVPLEANTLSPPDAFKLPKFQAGMVCEVALVIATVELQPKEGVALVVDATFPFMVNVALPEMVKVPVPVTEKSRMV